MATFEARYPGVCQDCGTDIEAGDEVGYSDGDLLCEDCYLFWADD